MEIITASYLFAKEKHNLGIHKCYYCGLPCGEEFTKKEYVKNTFTNRDIVKYPGSDYVCGCCVESLITGYTTKLIDGEIKTGRGGSPRMYSWVLTLNKKIAMTKRHLRVLRRICFCPPEPPFSIILSDSGQKQLIFRAPVNHDRTVFSLLLEEKVILVNPEILKDYLQKAVMISASCGKPSLKNPDNFNTYKNVIEYYGNENPIVDWINIYKTPMGELAAWLCPGKEDAKNDGNVISRRVSPETGGIDRRIPEHLGDGERGSKIRSDQALLDFA